MLAHLRVQVGSDSQESVLGVGTQAMVVKAPSKYGERFATSLEWFGLLVVKKTWLMCPFKVTVRCIAHLRAQVGSDSQKSFLGVWTQAMVVKAPPRYGERFAPRLVWFGLLAVKKTWLMCPFKVTVRCVSALASSSGLRPTGVSSWSLDSSNGC